ncbi:hypothetical protein KKF34_10975 [Myxococcota bacterium]|nr:hypothetical protein [Myxococcota bacterium]MBU1379927.1 hypothetical protein [Myxococcota bacterium]MBU1497388.1 hypothetical protein [Myxococcota bacterium]
MKSLIFIISIISLISALGGCDDDTSSSTCNNGILDDTEQCDGLELGGESCTSLGYYGGTLSCTSNCSFDLASCEEAGWCGDGVLNGDEECDENDTGNVSCESLGHGGGILGCTSECTIDITTCENPSVFLIEDLNYQGAFRFAPGTYGNSSVDYAIGTLAYNQDNHSLFIAGHDHQQAVGEFPVVEPGNGTTAAELPVTLEPLQGFVSLLETVDNPDGINRTTGMLYVDGALIVNAENWYDAGGTATDTTLIVNDADNLAGETDGFFKLSGRAHCGGYMGRIPEDFQNDFNATYYTGWSSVYSIVSRYSVGPSLWTFNPAEIISGDASVTPEITAVPYMNFAYHEGMLSERAVENAAQGTEGPFEPASPLWNILSRGVYGFFVPGTRTFAVIGSTGGLTSGIGYKAVQSDGNVCGGPCPYDPDDVYNYYWLFDVDEILAAENLFDPRPYAYGIWELPFDDAGHHRIIGATLDDETGTLYIALANAGQVGDYDRPPVILVYTLPSN